MTYSYLLIDFGASRIKSALLTGDNIHNVQNHQSVEPCINENKRFEIDPEAIKNKFIEIVNRYVLIANIKGVFICSEMHGFMLLDKNNAPISNYISWKTERSTNITNKVSSFDLLSKKLGKKFFEKTGMKPRACYPIFNLFDMIRNNEIQKNNHSIKVITLPEWLCCCDGKSLNKAHITMSVGLGFYNIYEKTFDKELIEEIGVNSETVFFNKVVEDVEIGGYIDINNQEIPIYTGVGDHQCAVLGAGNASDTISLNLGTGSQVAIIDLNNKNCEKRPFLNNKILSVIPHIPSGRALNCYMNFLKNISPDIDFWQKLNTISLNLLLKSELDIDLAIFKSAWGFSANGRISNISEDNFTLENYLASVLKNYIEQYLIAIKTLDPSDKYNKIILSGGIPPKLPVISEYLKANTNFQIITNYNEFDETFLGLRKIAKALI